MKAILRYPGSKWRMVDVINSYMPEHHSYLEPFFGSGAVLFNKGQSNIETVNDLNGDVVNLFKVIRDRPDELAREVFFTPYSRQVYNEVFLNPTDNPILQARDFMIKSLMSHGFRLLEKSGWKNDIHGRGKAYGVRHWNDIPDIIQEATLRLKDVQIECMPAVELIKRFNHSKVFMYIDPPYLLETRTRKQYAKEMEDEDHVQLLEVIQASEAKIMISGYNSDLYESYLDDWYKVEIDARAEKGLKRTEVLWMNYPVNERLF